MTIYKNVSPSVRSFKVTLTNDGMTNEPIVLSQYELSRNNINGKEIKAVKIVNWDSNGINIFNGADRVEVPPLCMAVVPFEGDTGDINIGCQWIMTRTHEITFYRVEKSSIFVALPPPP